MSSSVSKLRILLDTTYLLPIVGIDVEGIEKVLNALSKLHRLGRVEIFYTPFNILEILGKLSRINFDRERVELGLKSIREAFTITYPTAKGYLKALELRKKGFKDLIDLLLYATAKTRRLIFLTRDVKLVEFLKGIGEEITNVILEDDFVKQYEE